MLLPGFLVRLLVDPDLEEWRRRVWESLIVIVIAIIMGLTIVGYFLVVNNIPDSSGEVLDFRLSPPSEEGSGSPIIPLSGPDI
jgi:hypothetical protein